MKCLSAIFVAMVLVLEFFAPSWVHAQGTLYLSNLEQTPIASGAVGSDSWIAQGFLTGTNSGGYVLNSVQLLMNAASGNPSGFSVSIYTSINGLAGSPGSSLGTLSGSNPSAGGLYNYTASDIVLSSYQLYFIILTAATPVATGEYNWSTTSYHPVSTTPDIWDLDNVFYNSSDGLKWNSSRLTYFQLGIYATPVPEPSACGLLGFSLFGLGFWRLQQKSAKRAL